MTSPLADLVDLLDLEPIEVDIFRGAHQGHERQRTYGGQVAGQALMAAGRTVEHGRVHSLHSYFLRPGDASAPIVYEVDRIRDGKSFSTRRVVALQHGQAIFNMEASFHTDEVSLEHQVAMPDVPGPDTILPLHERVVAGDPAVFDWFSTRLPVEQRFVGELPWSEERRPGPGQQLWIKADGELPDDPLLHACIVTFASDMNLVDAIMGSYDGRWTDGRFMVASLDHCMWFHRPVKADGWLFYDIDSPIAHGGRGLARGQMFDLAGKLQISVTQEGLTRQIR